MNAIQAKAERLFANCFTDEELKFLYHHPRFIEVTHEIESIVAAFDAVEFGQLLIRRTWKRPNYFMEAQASKESPSLARS